ncbi:DUF1028 domain-containing protein [Microvirga lotononidis]|uniref:Pilus assembly protein n=1 Tax=Microvirga lotononidis TaxID=864069 RepID=I4YL33_9HYPH|nr:DUF1028 domain-containing protein [Microvirga lotononidis]EIM24675.1 hypothetical protein MicloDRAFT_00053900 [Microvirga lotononidis]WQO26687.1 DUF1028 domain-containing protein [Microvirga lotononidis]
MTWSIIAKDPETGAFGVAVTTKFFAVGALCPYGAARIGALATQALVNPLYGTDGVRLLAEGRSAEEIVAILTAQDPGRGSRQLQVIDRDGRTAAHTGSDCIDWCGHLTDEGVSVAGNMLAGPTVIEATLETYGRRRDLPFADRLMTALDAGQAEGGDKRGKQSAAIKIWHDEPYPMLDLRVDDHAEPLDELRRLYGIAHERFLAFMDAMATRGNPGGITDRSWIDERAREYQERRAASSRR